MVLCWRAAQRHPAPWQRDGVVKRRTLPAVRCEPPPSPYPIPAPTTSPKCLQVASATVWVAKTPENTEPGGGEPPIRGL